MRLEIAPRNCAFEFLTDKIASDKSISHRCAIFSLLASEPSEICGFLQGEDTQDSLKIAQKLGLRVEASGERLLLTPPTQIAEPNDILHCGNAGTAIRLYLGLLAAQKGLFVLSGDAYLNKRPMKRVVAPLRDIGAEIYGRDDGNLAPLIVRGRSLKAFKFHSKIASAQVKSAMILAALFSDGVCEYTEPEQSRDHSEKMLCGMGAEIQTKNLGVDCGADYKVTINPLHGRLKPLNMSVPSDPSSAFFFALAIAITPNARGVLKNVLLNKTRLQAFLVLEKMGVGIEYRTTSQTYEQIGDIKITAPQRLSAVEISERISWLIDEIPALAIAMACARGVSVVRNARELRVKETDRIAAVAENLRKCGILVSEREDGFEITGGEFKRAEVDSFGDHRIAMSFAIAGLRAGISITNAEYINISFPNFTELLAKITSVTQN